MPLSVEWKIEELKETDPQGRRVARIHETYSGIDDPPEAQTFDVLGLVARTFIQGRRLVVQTQLAARGYDLSNAPPIDWEKEFKGSLQ